MLWKWVMKLYYKPHVFCCLTFCQNEINSIQPQDMINKLRFWKQKIANKQTTNCGCSLYFLLTQKLREI